MRTNHTMLKPDGEFALRLQKNFSRLQQKEYTPEAVFALCDGGYNWPGDWEGRLLLALSLHRKATGAQARYSEQLLSGVFERLEPKGYLGKAAARQGLIDEQQLAGHSWLLRGLMSCMDIFPDERFPKAIRRILETLYLPTLGAYARYPLGDCRERSGKAIGNLQAAPINGWLVSTDIGCCFIALDALSEYELRFRDGLLLPLLREMAESFMQLDYLSGSMQTHASLSAARGILHLYQITAEQRYLDFAKGFLRLYMQEGMTENYANFNWFQRPEWTEPCAIVDSYLLATELFKLSKNAQYAELANRIFYNGLLPSQRANGGFGCDRCVESDGRIPLETLSEYYEAYWCCSMRGAEGLCYALQNMFLPEAGQGIFLNYISGKYVFREYSFSIHTSFPRDGLVQIHMEHCPQICKLQLWLPHYCDTEKTFITVDHAEAAFRRTPLGLSVDIHPGCEIAIHMAFTPSLAPTLHANDAQKHSFWYGIQQFGCDADDQFDLDDLSNWQYNEDGCFTMQNHTLYPIQNRFLWEKETLLHRNTRFLF